MKKIALSLCCILVSFSVFAQSQSVKNAARKTAERYLKLAENAMIQYKTDAAYSNTQLALSYDDSISDLYYMEALIGQKNGMPLSEINGFCETAFEKNNWIHDNLKGAKILYSDILSELGQYEKSLALLDTKPMVYSADAEVIRVKDYYRLGTDEALEKARQKISSARRVYKNDLRFPALFFSFETNMLILDRVLINSFSQEDEEPVYNIDESVIELAQVLELDLKKTGVSDAVYSLYPAFFMDDPEKRQRKILEFDASGNRDILWAAIALENGIIDQTSALEYFFDFACEKVSMMNLTYFITLLDESEVLARLEDYLTAYEGTILMDSDMDLLYEMEVTYERGRPKEILYDAENDGVYNLSAACDFGEIITLSNQDLGLEVQYSAYPYVSSAKINTKVLSDLVDSLSSTSEVIYFSFAEQDALYEPVGFDTISELDYFEKPFFIPELSAFYSYIDNCSFVSNASSITGENFERRNGHLSYSLDEGVIVSCDFYEGEKLYAQCLFDQGVPFERVIDYDGDGYFETVESFSLLFTPEEVVDYDSAQIITKVFSVFDFSNFVYLSGIRVDSDMDTVYEFMEEYGQKGAKTTSWDYDADGIPETTYIRYEKNVDEPLVEEAIFIYGFEKDVFSVMEIDGEPVAVRENEDEYEIKKGNSDKFFWICKDFDENKADFVTEQLLSKKMEKVDQGMVRVFDTETDSYFVIKCQDFVFARLVPSVLYDDEEVLDVLEEEIEDNGLDNEIF